MKRKILLLISLCLFAFMLAGCDEVLSVVTVDTNGEKIVHNYVSIIKNKIYDESVSLKSWQEIEIIEDGEMFDLDDLLFNIENKKENLVVLGDEDAAIEICFFNGGYKYTLFQSMEEMNRNVDVFSSSLDSLF